MKNARLVLDIPGLAPDALAKGLAAAAAFLQAAGVTPAEAAAARWKLEGEREPLTDAEVRAADAWEQAQAVAIEAASPGAEACWPLSLEFDR